VTGDEPTASSEEHIEDLTNRLGRSPRPSEVSDEMDVELDEVIEAIAERREPIPGQDGAGAESDEPQP
jgi:DNA-directed RNA polymerase specialized sigma subunit